MSSVTFNGPPIRTVGSLPKDSTYRISRTDLDVSRIAYGCMRIGAKRDPAADAAATQAAAFRALHAAMDAGVNLFDHADIYAGGESEAVFGAWLAENPGLRDRIVVQSKCGIRFAGRPRPEDPHRYDFSRAHIVASVDGSLRRLRTDRMEMSREEWYALFTAARGERVP